MEAPVTGQDSLQDEEAMLELELELDPEDSADLTPESLHALLEKAKAAGKTAAKRTRIAFSTMRTPPPSKKFKKKAAD